MDGTGTPARDAAARREQYELGMRVALAWREMRRGAAMSAVREHFLVTGDDVLEQGQMDTLDLLAEKATWRMSELAEALRVDPSTATRAVQRLVADGLAERAQDEGDGRVVVVRITDAGRTRHTEVNARRAEVIVHILRSFTPAERPVLAEMLERFIGAIDDFVDHMQSSVKAP